MSERMDLRMAKADVAFLLDRVRWAGYCRFTEDREVGISSNSIVAIAYGQKTLAEQEMPMDQSDLAACKRAVAKLPLHRQTTDVWKALERARRAVEG